MAMAEDRAIACAHRLIRAEMLRATVAEVRAQEQRARRFELPTVARAQPPAEGRVARNEAAFGAAQRLVCADPEECAPHEHGNAAEHEGQLDQFARDSSSCRTVIE